MRSFGLRASASSAVLVLALALAAGRASAAGDADCVNIAGSEPISQKQTMDPGFIVSTDDQFNVWNIYEPLIDTTPTFELRPRLATSWEPNADATVWTFHLREGVKFHDGSDFGAKDVVWTFRRLMDKSVGSPAASILSFLTPDGIEAVDAHTVRFTVKKPVVDLPTAISSKFSGIVKENSTSEELAAKGNGTGAFMVEQFTRGGPVRIFRKNPNYWDTSLPKAACLKITSIPEPVSMSAALLSGKVDFAPVIDATTAASLANNPALKIYQSKGGVFHTLSMQVDVPPFDDVRVRQAMKLVIDRQAIVDTVLLGFGGVANDNPVLPISAAAYTTDMMKRDVAKAKALLAEAGHPDGIAIDLYTADVIPGATRLASSYAAMAADAGIKVNVVVTPADSFWDDVWLKKSFITSNWGLRPPGPALNIAYRSTAAWNETHWKNEKFDALLDKAAVTVDAQERADVYKAAQKMLAEEGGVIGPVYAVQLSAMSSKCSGFRQTLDSQPDFREISCEGK
jgi:peptide/nickel transport system substrate-binding protein